MKQIVDELKSSHVQVRWIADELLAVLKPWRQITEFSGLGYWIFASTVKLGRRPLSYTFVWRTLDEAAKTAGIGHISSHTFHASHMAGLGGHSCRCAAEAHAARRHPYHHEHLR